MVSLYTEQPPRNRHAPLIAMSSISSGLTELFLPSASPSRVALPRVAERSINVLFAHADLGQHLAAVFSQARLATAHGERLTIETVRGVRDFYLALAWMPKTPKEPGRLQMRVTS